MVRTASILGVAAMVAGFAAAQVIDGGFENSTVNSTPSAPWTTTGGIASVSNVAVDLFPSEGTKYLRLDPGTTTTGANEEPSFGPHTSGNYGQVTQVVTRPPGAFCTFSIDWEFIPREPLNTLTANDFLSIDLVNHATNTLIANVVLLYVGTSPTTAILRGVPGIAGGRTWIPDQTGIAAAMGIHAPAGFKRAFHDLSLTAPGTQIRIEITVGNDENGFSDSMAFIDNVRISGGQKNSASATLRALGSASGTTGGSEWSADLRVEAPYVFRTAAGQRLALRAATNVLGTQWILIAGTLKDPGVVTPYGLLNIDLAAPFWVLIDGTAAGDPFAQYLGTIASGVSHLDLQVPDTTPNGTKITLQGAMLTPSGAAPITLTAATTIEIGPPQIPIGQSLIGTAGTGANADNGNSGLAFSTFGAWPFYGVNQTSVQVGSNGFFTFGAGNDDAFESEAAMFSGPPRIAAIWDDFVPDGVTGLVKTTQTAQTLTVSWTNLVEKFQSIDGNNFTIQLYQGVPGGAPAGVFTIFFGSSTMEDGLCGISPGGLTPPAVGTTVSVDLDVVHFITGGRFLVPPGTPRFQRFLQGDLSIPLPEKFDLMTICDSVARITFVPDGAGGYTSFTGTR